MRSSFLPRSHGSIGAGVLCLAVAMALGLSACGDTVPKPVLVFAAASLEDAIADVAVAFTSRTRVGVALNTAGSNVLARQIEAGAPADLFVSADARWVDDLIAAGALDPASRRELLTNRLVVIAHPDAGFSLQGLGQIGGLGFRYLSLADPDAVPAGRYARSLLEQTPTAMGTAWDQVASRVAPAPDVRGAVALVAAEPRAVGIVYRTDVAAAGAPGVSADGGAPARRGVAVLLEIDRESDPPIRYVAALSRRSPRLTPGSAELLDFLSGDEARAIFERHGFLGAPR